MISSVVYFGVKAMRDLIVLAMHGITPKDFPKQEKREFRRLHTQIENAGGSADAVSQRRYGELDQKIRAWPRTKENDPYCFASNDLGVQLGRITKKQIKISFYIIKN